jgi:hypothetical protein
MSKSTPSGGPGKSAKPARPVKPAKPYPDFPLSPHATRRWAKKIKGRMVYFGPWEDPEGALKKYLEERDDLYAGRRPRRSGGELTVRDLCNAFLTSKRRLVDSGERTLRTFDDYYQMCKRIVDHFGRDRLVTDLRPDDFGRLRAEMARRYGPVTLRARMQIVRVAFNFAFGSGLIDRPVNYGQEFQKPSMKTVRLAKAGEGSACSSRTSSGGCWTSRRSRSGRCSSWASTRAWATPTWGGCASPTSTSTRGGSTTRGRRPAPSGAAPVARDGRGRPRRPPAEAEAPQA